MELSTDTRRALNTMHGTATSKAVERALDDPALTGARLTPVATGHVLANVSGADAVPVPVPIAAPGTGQAATQVLGLDADGKAKGIHIQRTGFLDDLLAADATGEIAMAIDVARLVVGFPEGADTLGPLRAAIVSMQPLGAIAGAQSDQSISGLRLRPRLAVAIAHDALGGGASTGFQNLAGTVDAASVGQCLQYLPNGPEWTIAPALCSVASAAGTYSVTSNIIAVGEGSITVRHTATTPVDGAIAMTGHLVLIGD